MNLVAILMKDAETAQSARQECYAMARDGLVTMEDAVVVYRRPLLWGSTAAVIGTTLFIPANELDDRFVDYFDQTIAFRQDTDFATENQVVDFFQYLFTDSDWTNLQFALSKTF